MKVIRPISLQDAESFERMAFTSGPGITNLPKDAKLLQKRIQESLKAFQSPSNSIGDHFYIFVLEDFNSKEIEGTSGIRSRTGLKDPLCFYKQEKLKTPHSEISILRPISYFNGPSELIGLYLFPKSRKHGSGHLLSLSRLFFLAAFPQRFTTQIKAEIRGWIDEKYHCPFWEGIGRHFSDISLEEILKKIVHNRQLVSEILPDFPIYVPLLPQEVQNVIGITHPHTIPAQKMLEKEGFTLTGEIDIIDGGPVLSVNIQEIKSIVNSSLQIIKDIKPVDNQKEKLISNERLDFRACQAPLKLETDGIVINAETAKSLNVSIGDKVRIAN
jgi:arginine N-succinyltransferase